MLKSSPGNLGTRTHFSGYRVYQAIFRVEARSCAERKSEEGESRFLAALGMTILFSHGGAV